jgi:LacI family transcriptional regulator
MDIGTNELHFDSPKHLSLQIVEIFERKIISKEIPVGEKLPSQDDLFKMFNVSLGTMKEALSILAKEGYIARRRKHGTFVISDEPRKGINLKRKNAIGFVMSPTFDPYSRILFHEVTDGAEEKARGNKLNMIYRIMDDNAVDFGGMENDIAGLILAGSVTKERIRKIRNTKIPFVLIGDPDGKEKADETLDVVGNDDYQRAYLATKHLVELGHRKILYINRSISGYSWEAEMFNGYKKALQEGNIEYDKKLVLETGRFEPGDFNKAMMGLIDKRVPFTGVVCAMQDGVMSALNDRSIKVPEDVSVVVCNNFSEGLTNVSFNSEDMGRAAVELLCEKVSSEQWEPRRVLVESRLKIGNSTRLLSDSLCYKP